MNRHSIPGSLRRIQGLPKRLPGCAYCANGSFAIVLRCWQCSFAFHTHPEMIARVPLGALVIAMCPDPTCDAPNEFLRVPFPDGLVNPGDYIPLGKGYYGTPRPKGFDP